MDVVDAAECHGVRAWWRSAGAGTWRTNGCSKAQEGSPDNYMLVMSKEPKSFFSPRHRHPWDQVRYCLEGKIPIAKGVLVEAGEIAYFPESVHYGPQEGGEDRIVVLLQFGGASGQGFIGPDRVKQARLELAQNGRFENGVYTRDSTQGRINRDAYEAIWLHVIGGELSYALPAYKTPIIMRPQALSWLATTEPGVSVKDIGVFPHRGLVIDAMRLQPHTACRIAATRSLRFLFVTEGAGMLGAQELKRWSAARLQPGEGAELQTTGGLELLELSVRQVADLNTPANTLTGWN